MNLHSFIKIKLPKQLNFSHFSLKQYQVDVVLVLKRNFVVLNVIDVNFEPVKEGFKGCSIFIAIKIGELFRLFVLITLTFIFYFFSPPHDTLLRFF
jgi:hypothetical protein